MRTELSWARIGLPSKPKPDPARSPNVEYFFYTYKKIKTVYYYSLRPDEVITSPLSWGLVGFVKRTASG